MLFLAAMLLLPTAAARAQVTVSLQPAARQEPSLLPYRTGQLRIDNDSPRTFRTLWLRWNRGGPALSMPVTVTSKTPGTTVLLPLVAIWPRQEYDIQLTEEPGAEPLKLTAAIDWPAELLAPELFVDPPAYQQWENDLPPWPAELRQNVFVTGILFGLGATMTLLISRPSRRVLTLLFVTGAGVFAMIQVVRTAPLLVERIAPPPAVAAAASRPAESRPTSLPSPGETPTVADVAPTPPPVYGLIVVTTRRTATWNKNQINIAPVYENLQQLQDDTTTLLPGVGVTATIAPDQVRLFRRPVNP